MSGFFSRLFSEFAARRRRLRAALGDRGQGLIEFTIFGGVLVGALGLFVGPWMPAAAPWGFAVPAAFVAGYLLIEARRQRSFAAAETKADMHVKDEDGRTPMDRLAGGYDGLTLGWSLLCALLGAAAFVIAWSAKPPELDKIVFDKWSPPESAVPVDISP
jgi:hypothetical protein